MHGNYYHNNQFILSKNITMPNRQYIHSTPINVKAQVVLELFNPIIFGFYGYNNVDMSSPTKPCFQ